MVRVRIHYAKKRPTPISNNQFVNNYTLSYIYILDWGGIQVVFCSLCETLGTIHTIIFYSKACEYIINTNILGVVWDSVQGTISTPCLLEIIISLIYPVAHFTKDFRPNSNSMEISFCFPQVVMKKSLQNISHDTAAVLL